MSSPAQGAVNKAPGHVATTKNSWGPQRPRSQHPAGPGKTLKRDNTPDTRAHTLRSAHSDSVKLMAYFGRSVGLVVGVLLPQPINKQKWLSKGGKKSERACARRYEAD